MKGYCALADLSGYCQFRTSVIRASKMLQVCAVPQSRKIRAYWRVEM